MITAAHYFENSNKISNLSHLHNFHQKFFVHTNKLLLSFLLALFCSLQLILVALPPPIHFPSTTKNMEQIRNFMLELMTRIFCKDNYILCIQLICRGWFLKSSAKHVPHSEHLVAMVSIVLSAQCLAHKNSTFHTGAAQGNLFVLYCLLLIN